MIKQAHELHFPHTVNQACSLLRTDSEFNTSYSNLSWNTSLIVWGKYRIVGNFRGRKYSRIGKIQYCGENFCKLLAFAAPKVPHPKILQRKLSQIATKNAKFAKVFSLESFRYTVKESGKSQQSSHDIVLGLRWMSAKGNPSTLICMQSWCKHSQSGLYLF